MGRGDRPPSFLAVYTDAGACRPDGALTFDHCWRVKTRLPERKGQRCRVLARSTRLNSVLVEFEDGYKVVTSAWFVRPHRPVTTPDLFTENVRLDEEPAR